MVAAALLFARSGKMTMTKHQTSITEGCLVLYLQESHWAKQWKYYIPTLEFLLYMKSCRINLFIGLSLDIPPRVNWVKYYKILMKIAMAPSCGNLLSNFTSRVTQKSLKCPKNLFRLFLHAWNVNMLLSIMN